MNRRKLLAIGAGTLGLGAVSAHAQQIPRSGEFEITTPAGPLKLGQYKGKTVVFALIRSSCSHCQEVTQILRSLQQEFGPKVQMVACDFVEDGPVVVPRFIDQFKPGFPVGWTSVEKAFLYLQLSMMTPGTVPKLVFIDRKGLIRAQYDGSDPIINTNVSRRDKIKAKILEVAAL